MRNVRLFYEKRGRMRFVSHLEMTRFMTRIIRRAKLPVWYTEGFNPHLYLTFALPLSLGMESRYEVIDIRLTDDSFDISALPELLNAVSPEYVHFFDVCEPIRKTGAVAFADFEVCFEDDGKMADELQEFFASKSLVIQKKTKKGEIKELEVADKIVSARTEAENGKTRLFLRLPAGSNDNLNPELLLNLFFETRNYYCYIITRTAIYDGEMKLFR